MTYIYLIFFVHAVSDGFYRSTEVGCVWPGRIVLHESGASMEAHIPEGTVHVSPPISKRFSFSAAQYTVSVLKISLQPQRETGL